MDKSYEAQARFCQGMDLGSFRQLLQADLRAAKQEIEEAAATAEGTRTAYATSVADSEATLPWDGAPAAMQGDTQRDDAMDDFLNKELERLIEEEAALQSEAREKQAAAPESAEGQKLESENERIQREYEESEEIRRLRQRITDLQATGSMPSSFTAFKMAFTESPQKSSVGRDLSPLSLELKKAKEEEDFLKKEVKRAQLQQVRARTEALRARLSESDPDGAVKTPEPKVPASVSPPPKTPAPASSPGPSSTPPLPKSLPAVAVTPPAQLNRSSPLEASSQGSSEAGEKGDEDKKKAAAAALQTVRRLTTNPHKCTLEILEQWRNGGESRKNIVQLFFQNGCDVTKTTVSFILKDIMMEPISKQEKKKKEALTEEQVYAHYAPNQEKAKMAIHFAVQEGRRYLSFRDDPNFRVGSGHKLFNIFTEMSETELFEKRREIEANVRSLAQDQRPLARQLFQEMHPSCKADIREIMCFDLCHSKQLVPPRIKM
ncbi:unnamed protein product [Symbiodinium sp. CCMP2592]|nr:unnamed protein product [Symbiodinium sp. CCMP2592]